MLQSSTALRTVKLLHTLVWAFFAGCILVIPVFAWQARFDRVAIVSAIVLVEVVVLAANRWHCPLTGVAGHYTEDRKDNFDIYLPLWLARYNKPIFGFLFLAGLVLALGRWLWWR